jgi:RNA polymerase sigma-70 factor (ECF subfamily)
MPGRALPTNSTNRGLPAIPLGSIMDAKESFPFAGAHGTGHFSAPSGEHLLVGRSLVDPNVFIELYDRYAPGVHHYALLRLGEDLVDEVVVRTFLTRPMSFRAWIYGIAGRVISSYPCAETDRFRAAGRDSGIAALHALRKRERDALLLVAWARLPMPEAAQALGVSTERLGRRLDRALQRIACHMPARSQ